MEQQSSENIFSPFGCVLSIMLWLVSITEAKEIVSIGAGLAGIVCAGFTSYYYHKKAKSINHAEGNKTGS